MIRLVDKYQVHPITDKGSTFDNEWARKWTFKLSNLFLFINYKFTCWVYKLHRSDLKIPKNKSKHIRNRLK